MLGRIIEDLLAGEGDMVVVGRSSREDDPLRSARDAEADMLITQDGEGGDTCLDAILSAPTLNVLAIDRDGRNGSSISFARKAVALEGEGTGGLPDVIRRVAVQR